MQYIATLNNIESKALSYGEKLQKPASTEQIAKLCVASRAHLQFEIPHDYVEFLKLHNGIDWNGFSIYATEIVLIDGYADRYINGFVDANLQYWEIDNNLSLICFGETGDSRYVFDLQQKIFCQIDTASLDTIESYLTFEKMCASLLSRSII